MAIHSKSSGKKISDMASTVALNSKPATYAVSNRLTTSEDEWLRQQKKLVNETYRQSKSTADAPLEVSDLSPKEKAKDQEFSS